MQRTIHIAGIGPGSLELLTPAACSAIEQSDVLIGGRRNLEMFRDYKGETLVIGNNLRAVCEYIVENAGLKKITVIASGDPGLFSITRYLRENLQGIHMEVIPGISSLQYLCSKVNLSWEDLYITSVHGRTNDIVQTVKEHEKVGIFTGGGAAPDGICRSLVQAGLDTVKVVVGENLSYPEERVFTGSAKELMEMNFHPLSLMIVQRHRETETGAVWDYSVPGVPDAMFDRAQVPMTKEEIRAVSVSKLRLNTHSVVYDVGAGTGSVSVECALRCPQGGVYAFERDTDAVDLIKRNAEKFRVQNVKVIPGEAPESFTGEMQAPDRVFIGGSGGNMGEIIGRVTAFGGPVRIVINTITVESTYEALEALKTQGCKNIEIISMSIARGREVGGKHLMQSINPVYIISGEKGEEI